MIEIRKQLPIETKTAQAYVMYGNESVQDMSLDTAARFTITVAAFEKAVELYKSLPTDHKWVCFFKILLLFSKKNNYF